MSIDREREGKKKYLVLDTNIPDSEADVLVFHSFNIKPYKTKVTD